MEKYVPQKSDFDSVKKIDKVYTRLLCCSFAISISSVFAGYWQAYRIINMIFIFIYILLIVSTFTAQIYRDIKLNDAENIRRDTLIDDAFGSKIADESSLGYYDNTDINHGYKRLLANICENSLFSVKIASKMLWKSIVLSAILIAAVICCSVIGFSNVSFAIPLMQILMSVMFVFRTVGIFLYKYNVKIIYDKAKLLLGDSSSESKINITSVLQLLIRYESNISRFQIILDEKAYIELNPELTKKWDENKKRYNIC